MWDMKSKDRFGLDRSLVYHSTFLDLRPRHFNKQASLSHDFLTRGCHDALHFYKWASSIRTFSTKNEAFGWTNTQTHKIFKQWETSTAHTYAASTTCVRGANVDTHFHDTFRTSLIQLSSTSLQAQFMYYILFYSFKQGPSPCNFWGKLRKCSLEDMGWFLSEILHEPNTYMLPSGQGTLVAPQAYGEGLVPEISTPKEFLYSG